jgi:hypothetical protein
MTAKNKIIIFLLAFTVSLLFIGATISVFFLLYSQPAVLGKRTNKALQPTPTALPTPTPTPPYFSYLTLPANYVGKVIEIRYDPPQIVLERDDSSRVKLDLKPDVHIYVVNNNQAGGAEMKPDVTIEPLEYLANNDTLSIYTEDKNIHAIFLLK